MSRTRKDMGPFGFGPLPPLRPHFHLGDVGRLPDGTLGMVVRAKSGTSPARRLAHEERARRNVERLEIEKRATQKRLCDDTVSIRMTSFFVFNPGDEFVDDSAERARLMADSEDA